MQKRGQLDGSKRKMIMPYVTSEMSSIMRYVEREIGDAVLVQSMHFSPTALALVRRVMRSGGRIITDTALAMNDIDTAMVQKLKLRLHCFIDDANVIAMAMHKRVTRAEIAMDYALTLSGMKLIVIGSAPMALNRLLERRQTQPLTDTVVLAMPTGFASAVQLKERLWESGIPCIVVRGKKGGTEASVATLHALMDESIREQNL